MRALKTTGIVLGVAVFLVAIVFLWSTVMLASFRRTSLAIGVVASMGITCVTLAFFRSRGEIVEQSNTLVAVGTGLLAFAAFYAVLINETVG